MEKKKQLIVVSVAVLVALALGILVYLQFAGRSDYGTRGELERRAAELRQSAQEADEGEFETGTLPAIPEGPATVDDVVSGIEDDMEFEDDLLDEEATAEAAAFLEENDVLNEYDNVYEEDAF